MLASLFIFWACCSALAVANDPEVRKDTSRVVHLANNADATRDYRLHQFDKCHLAFELNAVYGKLATPRRTLADVHVDDHASCLSLCQENPQCSLFVWHGNFPEIVGAAWARLCVQLTREEVQKLHVGPAESWRPQIGVISGQCRRNEVRKTVTVARGVNFNNSNPSMDRKGHQRSLAGQVQPSGDLSSNYRRVIQLPFSTRAISFAAAESRSCLMPELIIRSPQMTSETALLEVRRRLTLEVRPVENQSLAVNESLSLNGSVALDTGCVAALHAAVSVTVYGPDLYARSRNRHILTADRQGSNGSLRFTFMPTVPGTFTVVFLVGNQRYVWFQKIVPRNSLRSPTSSLGNFSIPSRPNTSMAHRPLLNGQMYEKILRRILDTQAPQKKCDLSSTSGRNRKFYFYALADVMNYGLGSHIEYMAAAFGRAMALNRTFVVRSYCRSCVQKHVDELAVLLVVLHLPHILYHPCLIVCPFVLVRFHRNLGQNLSQRSANRRCSTIGLSDCALGTNPGDATFLCPVHAQKAIYVWTIDTSATCILHLPLVQLSRMVQARQAQTPMLLPPRPLRNQSVAQPKPTPRKPKILKTCGFIPHNLTILSKRRIVQRASSLPIATLTPQSTKMTIIFLMTDHQNLWKLKNPREWLSGTHANSMSPNMPLNNWSRSLVLVSHRELRTRLLPLDTTADLKPRCRSTFFRYICRVGLVADFVANTVPACSRTCSMRIVANALRYNPAEGRPNIGSHSPARCRFCRVLGTATAVAVGWSCD